MIAPVESTQILPITDRQLPIGQNDFAHGHCDEPQALTSEDVMQQAGESPAITGAMETAVWNNRPGTDPVASDTFQPTQGHAGSSVGSTAAEYPVEANDPPFAIAPGGGNVPTGHLTPALSPSDAERECISASPDAALAPTDPQPRVPVAGDYSPSEFSTLFEGGVGMPSDEWRIEEANRRLEILNTFTTLLMQGLTKADAAKQIGIGYVTIWRWQKRFAGKGFNGLLPETDKCGNTTVFEKLGMTPEQVEAVRKEVQGIALDTGSTTSAWRLFANSDRCPARLAEVILDPNRCSKHAIPPSARDLAKVPEPAKQAHRGPRRLSLKGMWTPRRMDILPGDIFVADDTTPIWAWWVPWREDKDHPFGVKLLQGQFIPVMDVASQCVVSYVIIAREKSSYRASDIWHLFGHTFDTVGLPRLGWQLERGSWESNIIRGQEIEVGTDEVTMSRRVGGLRQLPTNITEWHREKLAGIEFPKTLQTWTSFLPKTKSIEAFFNRSQTFEGTLWGVMGRDQMRNPYEKTKKLFQACQRGAEDPRLHFLSHEEMSERISALLRYVNSEPMEGEVFKGIPKINFDSAVAERPLFQLPEDLRWLYARDWAVVQITNGWARVRLTHEISGERYSLFYTNPELFAKHEGEGVVVYYDREHFDRPAQIILARTGDFLCTAQYEDRKGSFLGGDQSGYDIQKRWRNAVMSIYGTLVQHIPSKQIPAEIAARRTEAKTSSHQVVDNRPAAAPVQNGGRPQGLFAPATPQQIETQRTQLSRKAALAQRLRALVGDE